MTPDPDNWCPPPPTRPRPFVDSPPADLGVQTKLVAFTHQDMCRAGLQPILIEQHILDALRKLFQPENIPNPSLRRFIWNPDFKQSTIQIESFGKLDKDQANKRPAIFVKTNEYTNTQLAIRDLAYVSPTGEETFSVAWVGSTTVFCISDSYLSATHIAMAVRVWLGYVCRILERQLHLHKFRVVSVGAPSELEEAKEHYVYPIVLGWAFEDSMTVAEEAPLWQGVVTSSVLI